MKLSQIQLKNNLPSFKSFRSSCLLIYDLHFDFNGKKNLTLKEEHIKKWISTFPDRIGFHSGEDLKNIKTFPKKLEKILTLINKIAKNNIQIVSLGGGSIGDFAGFTASILKRGLPLIHIPTTWLAAIDSSHGGKTALNAGGFKNQVGTFYPADRVLLLKPILFTQPPERATEAFSESFKIAFLTGGSLWKNFSQLKTFNHTIAWRYLPYLIQGKYNIVKKDPYEKKGVRQLLNLGHTFGHIFEATHHLPHGTAISFGLRAAIELSKKNKFLSKDQNFILENQPATFLLPTRNSLIKLIQSKKISASDYFLADKKITTNSSLRFIYMKKPGKCPIQEIKITALLQFYSDLEDELL